MLATHRAGSSRSRAEDDGDRKFMDLGASHKYLPGLMNISCLLERSDCCLTQVKSKADHGFCSKKNACSDGA